MKTIQHKFIVLLFFVAIGIYAFGQENTVMSKKELRKLAKEQKLAERQAEAEKNLEIIDHMLNNRKFVLEANFLSGRTGQRIPVSPNINFVVVDSAHCVLQIGSPYGMGYNGVGGITVEGPVSRYTLKKIEKKKSTYYSLIFMTTTSAGVYDVSMYIDQHGNADATIRGTTAGSLSYHGIILHPELSKIYKAHSYP